MSAKALVPGDKITVLMWPWMDLVHTSVVHSYPELFSFKADGGGGKLNLFDRQTDDEGLTWCRGWDDAAGAALLAARLLAGSGYNPHRLP